MDGIIVFVIMLKDQNIFMEARNNVHFVRYQSFVIILKKILILMNSITIFSFISF